MSIKVAQQDGGARATGRRLGPSTVPKIPNAVLLGTTNGEDVIIGRKEQVTIIDRVLWTGQGRAWNTTGAGGGVNDEFFNVLKFVDRGGAAGAARFLSDFAFFFGQVGGTDLDPVRLDIQKFGVVLEGAATNGVFPASCGIAGASVANIDGLKTVDGMVESRHMSRHAAFQAGMKQGNFIPVVPGLFASGGQVFAAPGVGLHYRIHTLIVQGVGNASTGRLSLGTTAVVTDALIGQWYSTPQAESTKMNMVLTDIDIPVGENLPIHCAFTADFSLKSSVIIGVEIARVNESKFDSIAGAPA